MLAEKGASLDYGNQAWLPRENPGIHRGLLEYRHVVVPYLLFTVKSPRSVFLNRASAPLVLISRRIAE